MLGAQCRRNHIMTPVQNILYINSVWHYTIFYKQQQQFSPSFVKKCASLEGASAFFGLGQVNITIFLLLLPASAAERHADATARGGTIINVR